MCRPAAPNADPHRLLTPYPPLTSHQVCPYSRATRGNIEITLTVA